MLHKYRDREKGTGNRDRGRVTNGERLNFSTLRSGRWQGRLPSPLLSISHHPPSYWSTQTVNIIQQLKERPDTYCDMNKFGKHVHWKFSYKDHIVCNVYLKSPDQQICTKTVDWCLPGNTENRKRKAVNAGYRVGWGMITPKTHSSDGCSVRRMYQTLTNCTLYEGTFYITWTVS